MGERKRKRLMEKYPDGLHGILRFPHITRGKPRKPSLFKTHTHKEFIPLPEAQKIFPDDLFYDIVYHAWLEGESEKFLVAYSVGDAKGMNYSYSDFIALCEKNIIPASAAQTITIKKFWCVNHPFHRFIIGGDLEIYPDWNSIEIHDLL